MQIFHLMAILLIIILLGIKISLKKNKEDEIEKKYPTSARIKEKIKRIKEHREALNPYDIMRFRN